MSANHDTRTAWRFHNATKYTVIDQTNTDIDIAMGTAPNLVPAIGAQDPANEPQPFKVYRSAPTIALPTEFPAANISALAAISAFGDEGTATPTLASLAQLALRSNGLLKREVRPNGRIIDYRAAGCTGARYHLELYFITADLPGLDAGVYHYAVDRHTFRTLRKGDYRADVVEAAGGEPTLADAPAILAVTSTFWRNAWRYQARAYRHTFWDLGTLFGNLLSVSASQRIPAQVVLGYADDDVNHLLGVDGTRESTVALLALGRGNHAPASPTVTPLDAPAEPISAWEIEFPDITAMHAASKLSSAAEAAAWRANPLRRQIAPLSERIPLHPLSAADYPDMPIETVIQRRRSTRNYDTEIEIPFEKLSTLLDVSMRGFAADCLLGDAPALNDQYLIVNNVAGLQRGSYLVDPAGGGVQPLSLADARADAANLACGQQYAADAHVNIYYLANLEPILERYGNRGYRIAQLEGALMAGKLHLATHALGLGAVGSTSADDKVIDFFSPDAAGKSFMFILTFGQRRRKAG